MIRDTRGLLKRMLGRKSRHIVSDGLSFGPLDVYEHSAPSRQNAIDLIPGWNHAFPPEYELRAGPGRLYEDGRIHWAIQQLGSVDGRLVLELGPLEGTHTALIERLGAGRIDAVESNKLAYLRCLIAKEVYGLERSCFHLGDFVKYLAQEGKRYDLIVACGVLYHMADPLTLLELIAARTNAAYIWTHYFNEQAMPPGDTRRVAFTSQKRPRRENVIRKSFHGVEVALYERSYYNAWESNAFCGGPVDLHYWMDKADIIAVLGALGFQDIRVAHDDPGHVNGPSASIFVRRTR